jgi:hypothetical protein
MPAFIRFVRIEFHVENASPALRVAVRAAKADLDTPDHTHQTFIWRLRLFAQAHPEIRIDALIEDAYRVRWLLQARAGFVTETHVYPLLAGVDHDGQIAGLEPEYASEAELVAAVDRASDAHAEGVMVVDVGWERYGVHLEGGGANVLKAFPVDGALVYRLMNVEYSHVERALHRTDDMLRVLR